MLGIGAGQELHQAEADLLGGLSRADALEAADAGQHGAVGHEARAEREVPDDPHPLLGQLGFDADVGVAEAPPVLRTELAPRLGVDQHELGHCQQGQLLLDVVDAENADRRDRRR